MFSIQYFLSRPCRAGTSWFSIALVGVAVVIIASEVIVVVVREQRFFKQDMALNRPSINRQMLEMPPWLKLTHVVCR